MINRIYLAQKIRIIVIFVSLLSTSLVSVAQPNTTNFIKRQFEKYKEHSLQEKLFVHTDRNNYVAGEIMWFKVYCLNEDNSKMLNLSKVAYIEVLDKNQQPVLQAKVALIDGTGNGSIELPLNIRSGNYLFRAYTNWMKNFSPDFFFHQSISIINTIQTDTASNIKTPVSYDAQFFPEGGYLVDQLQSKVAFRVTDNSGKGIDFTGVIADEKGDTAARFSPSKFGIGSFIFTPQFNRRYKAFIRLSNGNIVTQTLPETIKSGVVMSVTEQEVAEKLRVNIQSNNNSTLLYLFIHAGNQVKVAELVNLVNGSAVYEIEKSKLGEGISHITLFNKDYEPLCERLYFIKPKARLTIEANTNSNDFSPRTKVTFDLSAKDESSKSTSANMSMSVFLTDSSSFNYKDIYSYLWMTSDLKGNIESPEYYFNNNSKEINQQSDNLMLTHGWRRFKWKEVLNEPKVLKFLPEYEGHIVSGKVMDMKGTAVADKSGYLSIPGRNFQLYAATSTAGGTIHFNTKDYYGTKLMVGLVEPDDLGNYKIQFDNPFSEDITSEVIPPFYASDATSASLLKRSINMQVQNTYRQTELQSFKPATIDTAHFYGKPDATYMLEDYVRFPTMEEVLREYVREIDVRKRQNKYLLYMAVRDEEGISNLKRPIILLDGLPQFDQGNKITNYDPLKVEKFEAVAATYFLGPARFNGIASFFTYGGDVKDFSLDTSAIVIDYDALQLRREFYMPAYETEQISSRMPDFRNLLFWSPDIEIDKDGKKEISFYTSDLPGKYAVVLQGFSADGKAGSKVFMLD
ncbi:MAG TPA: hypothetical protein VF623_04320, partial [Segetibacter sp.]